VTVDPQSDVLVGVSQPFRDDRNRHSVAEQNGRVAVAWRVQTETWVPRLLKHLFDAGTDPIRRVEIAVRLTERHPVISVI
jgi:hypothetical protein